MDVYIPEISSIEAFLQKREGYAEGGRIYEYFLGTTIIDDTIPSLPTVLGLCIPDGPIEFRIEFREEGPIYFYGHPFLKFLRSR